MFGMLESLAKAALGVVTVPIAVIADVVTLGGAVVDKDRPYTADAVSDVVKNLEDATKPK
jgi:predicted benzoate:H+ symporter BenE